MAKSDAMSRLVIGIIGSFVVAIFYASAGIYINSVSDAPCSIQNRSATFELPKYCSEINLYMKVLLIATHLLAFALFPFAMYVYWESAPKMEAKAAFSSVLGFAFFMVAICGEIGWHVGQQWFYQEEYHILNFTFYFFFMLGIAYWANGISLKTNESQGALDKLAGLANIMLFISPLVVTLVYGGGATLKTYCPDAEFCSSLPSWVSPSKVPIYILMALEFAILSIRMYRLLNNDWRVVLLPFFSVGVNLFFIFLLNANVNSTFLNPLYHTLHDLIGTELGVFIAALLVWDHARAGPPEGIRKKSN